MFALLTPLLLLALFEGGLRLHRLLRAVPRRNADFGLV
jgi:hypothetical protein